MDYTAFRAKGRLKLNGNDSVNLRAWCSRLDVRRKEGSPFRTISGMGLGILATASLLSVLESGPVSAQSATTAWSNGTFKVDVPNVVRRSNIILGQPNLAPTSSMPLGNGDLGAAVWSANGFTAQLNRDDTFPDRKSPGQVTIPGLSALTGAPDFSAHLDLYNGALVESGGGMTATIYVRATTDELVVDVTGANPSATQTVQGYLWSGRSPVAAASGNVATLAETFQDNETGGVGRTFGTLLALTAGGQNVTASVVNSETVQLRFTPNSNGSFRVIIGAPTWTGGNATSTATALFGSDATVASATLEASHLAWWNNFWASANLIEMSSADGSAQYLENLRTIYLYQEASMNRGVYPGTQAGVADLFDFSQDTHDWAPADYWFWNLRMDIAANLSSGVSSLNTPFFNLYTSNLANIEAWTAAHVPGSTGACVPETMRYNGNGFYLGTEAASNASCDTTIAPSYNAQTFSTGTEVSLWIWRQYQATNNLAFLQAGYPLMKAAAQFLLSRATLGSDGFLHTTANAHETQWQVTDPVTDILAMSALFPAVVSAASVLDTDQSFVSQLTTAETQIPPLPRTDAATHKQVLTASSDAQGTDVIAYSTQPSATYHNSENLDLEAVWPYNLIGDASPLTTLAARSYTNRLWRNEADWDDSAIEAARLDMPSQVQSILVQNVETYQAYPDGLANLFNGSVGDEPYDEQTGIVATALNEALVQDYDGTVRIAAGWPSSWTGSGSVSIQNNSKVDVQYENGAAVTVVLEAGATASQTVRSPWAGKSVEVIDATSGTTVVSPTTATTFSIPMTSGHKYLIEQSSAPFTSLSYAEVTGTPATQPKHLGSVRIGIDFGTLASAFDNVGTTADSDTNAGNFDGGGLTFSQSALSAVGATPGATLTVGGVAFTWPTTAGTGSPDNVVADGQTITLSGNGSRLGFLLAASYGPATGTGTITYTDGTTESFTLTAPDWWQGVSAGTVALSVAHLNNPGNTTTDQPVSVFFVGVPLTASKTLASVQLPTVSATAAYQVPALHLFAMAVQSANLASAFDNVGTTADSDTNAGNYDGGGLTFSENALSAVGATPGATRTFGGVSLTWPTTAGTGSPDNVVAAGQVIALNERGSTLGFLLAASYGAANGAGTITYTDGTTQTFSIAVPDWWGGPSAGSVAFAPTYLNAAGNTHQSQPVSVYFVGVPLNSSKTVATVQLPMGRAAPAVGASTIHIFSIGVQ